MDDRWSAALVADRYRWKLRSGSALNSDQVDDKVIQRYATFAGGDTAGTATTKAEGDRQMRTARRLFLNGEKK